MSNILKLIAFSFALIIGLMISSGSNSISDFDEIIHRDCVRWDEETIKKSLFTLEEGRSLTRRKVVSKNPNFRENEVGRIISLEMIGTDKFLIVIYWGKGADDEHSSLSYHDKDWFLKNFEVIN